MSRTPGGAATVRELSASDIDPVLSLNERWVPHVGSVDRTRLESILGESVLALVAETDQGLGGFVIVLGAGADYDSPNYRWFSARHSSFAYVDRIAIAPGGRGLGLGRLLYELVADLGRSIDAPVVCAEVNLEPPNPDSQRFHARMGFEEVGRQWTYDETVEVQLLERAI